MPPRSRPRTGSGTGSRTGPRSRPKAPSIAQQHAEWVGLLRPDGPFIAVTVLTDVFPQGLDTVPGPVLERLRQAWAEVQAAPDLLHPAWCELVLRELLRFTGSVLAEGAAMPDGLRGWTPADRRVRPDAVAVGPDGTGGRTERLLVYRRPWDEPLTKAGKDRASPVDQAVELCRRRGTPLALLTNGRLWVLVHARPGEPATIATFDADLWLEERELLRAFTTLLGAQRVLPPPTQPDGKHAASLAALFARSADAQSEITDTLGDQVRQAVELLVGEMARLDREAGGALLSWVPPRDVYRGALTVMMRLVFLLYAEEQRLLPIDADLYAEAYSVAGLFDQLETDRTRYGEGFGDRRAAAWPRLIATFRAVHGGCEHDELRIPPYGGGLFDPERYGWLESLHVTDRVVHAVLDALLVLRRRGAVRLSYKGLDVEQIGHVYEGLLEYSCTRVIEPHVGLIGKLEPELPLAELDRARSEQSDLPGWLKKTCDATPGQIVKALAAEPDLEDLARLDAACDNDAELAARAREIWGLLRKDLRGLPTVFPAGSLIITKVGDRRASGTHYTPRTLAEEVVEHTLAPLCFSPGPAEGADRGVWHAKTAGQLLDLKVLDPAMGSGAFLVSACRYLSARVVEAWERDGLTEDVIDAVGPDFDRDDLLLEARRRVAARCLYGVDRDDAAVELAKLSLWLVTLAKGKPFSFLDHALRGGDSLVGLISEAQVEAFHLDPERGRYINNRFSGIISDVTGPLLTRAQQLREQIEAEPIRDARHGAELAAKLAEAERLADRLRLASDAVVAAALSAAGDAKQDRRPHWENQDRDASDLFDDRLAALADDVERALEVDKDGWPTAEAEQADKQARAIVDPMLQGPRSKPITPLHWPLEFPEVMRRGGFDAVVGNPPFMGGTTISGHLGKDALSYFGQFIAGGNTAGGRADLCSYFLLRNALLGHLGRVGIVATNTIAQGDTREVGLDQLITQGWSIYRAKKSQKWPGKASIEISLVWIGNIREREERILESQAVSRITTSLDPQSRISGSPYKLVTDAGLSFEGCKPLGMGFILKATEARNLIERNPRNVDVIFPYLNGEDLNQRWDSSASRWIIDFNDLSIEQAREYPEVFRIIDTKVRPERQRRASDGSYVLRKPLPQRWWQYADRRPGLRAAIANLDRVLVIAIVSRLVMPTFVPARQVLANKLCVFASDRSEFLTLLSSSFHYYWAWHTSSTMKADLNYSPSDCFETFSQPKTTNQMEIAGEELNSHRQHVMARRRVGLTALYELAHSKIIRDEDITRLREIHVQIDEAVREAYAIDEEREPAIREFEARIASAPLPSWQEIDLRHGFHETRQGVRFTISPQARVDVLDKLLALNYYRHEQEQEKGLTRKKRRTIRKGPAVTKPQDETSEPIEDALFPRPDTLF